jgi:hypothetical protein
VVDFAFGVGLDVAPVFLLAAGVLAGFAVGVGEAGFFFVLGFAFGFAVGVGDSSGDTDAVARAFKNCVRFSSSVNCAGTLSEPISAPRRIRTASQRRKWATLAQGNRPRLAINAEPERDQTGCAAGAGGIVDVAASLSWRRIAFNFPPSSRNRQVRYIQVSRMIIDASAR